MSRRGSLLAFVALLGLMPLSASAQSDDEVNAGVQFNFSTPGARSIGMGGAFLGSVDDATAAYSNPAGLLQLTAPEVAVEGRAWEYSTPFANRGRATGAATGLGVDTLAEVELGQAESEAQGISFGAFVFPRPKWVAAVFYHQVAKYGTEFRTGGIFAENGLSESRLFPVHATYDLDISHAGVAYAQKWGAYSAGLSVSAYQLELASLTQRYDFPSFRGPADFSPSRRINFQRQSGDDQQVGYSLGLRWDPRDKVSVGLVYRYGPKFDLQALHASFSPDLVVRTFLDAPAVFDLPDVAGLGISLRPTQALTLNVDLHWVAYSDLTKEFLVIFPVVQDQAVDAEDFLLEDVVETHLGVEYVFTQWTLPIALRAGAWYDPEHRLKAVDGPTLNQARHPEGEEQVHVTAGFGLVLGAHFQLDAAVDFSDNVDTASVTALFRF